MADEKISDLPVAEGVDGSEPVAIVQDGVTKRTTTQDIANLGGGGLFQAINTEVLGPPIAFVSDDLPLSEDGGEIYRFSILWTTAQVVNAAMTISYGGLSITIPSDASVNAITRISGEIASAGTSVALFVRYESTANDGEAYDETKRILVSSVRQFGVLPISAPLEINTANNNGGRFIGTIEKVM